MRFLALSVAFLLAASHSAADAPLSFPQVDPGDCRDLVQTPDALRERFAWRAGAAGGIVQIRCIADLGGAYRNVWIASGVGDYWTARAGGIRAPCGSRDFLDEDMSIVGSGVGCGDAEQRKAIANYDVAVEGWTTGDGSAGLDLAPSHDVPTRSTQELCASAPRPAYLVTSTHRYERAVGEPLALRTLAVGAVDRDDKPLARVPIVVDVERAQPAIATASLDRVELVTKHTGSTRLRVRTLCAPGQREIELRLDVR